MNEAFWDGFEKKAVWGKLLRKGVQGIGKALGFAKKNPMTAAGGALTAAEGVSVASQASQHIQKAKQLSNVSGSLRPAGGTY